MDAILQENGDKILLETGDAVLLEQQAGSYDGVSGRTTVSMMMGVGA